MKNKEKEKQFELDLGILCVVLVGITSNATSDSEFILFFLCPKQFFTSVLYCIKVSSVRYSS